MTTPSRNKTVRGTIQGMLLLFGVVFIVVAAFRASEIAGFIVLGFFCLGFAILSIYNDVSKEQ